MTFWIIATVAMGAAALVLAGWVMQLKDELEIERRPAPPQPIVAPALFPSGDSKNLGQAFDELFIVSPALGEAFPAKEPDDYFGFRMDGKPRDRRVAAVLEHRKARLASADRRREDSLVERVQDALNNDEKEG